MAQPGAPPAALDGPPAPRVGALPGSPTARALELLEQGDTTGAIDFLQASVKRQFKDAPAWHLLGILRWGRIADVRGQAIVRDLAQIKEIAAADSSLRIATQLAPDSARYWLSLARFNIRSPYSTTLYASQWNARSAYNSAKANGEVDLLALAADLRGMTMWRRYEAVAHRGIVPEGQDLSDEALRTVARNQQIELAKRVLVKPESFTGLNDYTVAIDHFTEATEYEPSSQRYARHLFMALAEREQWAELHSVASRRARLYPLDYSSRMVRGLALQRLRRHDEARAAFDTAFITMDDGEREWLTSLTRILRWRSSDDAKQQGLDSVSFRRMSPAQQEAFRRMFWFTNDEVSLSGASVNEVEFLARVAYADVRFTDEDRGIRGAETDRGDIYIRYGPPDMQFTLGRNTAFGDMGGVLVNWLYVEPLAHFTFRLIPGFASVKLVPFSRTELDSLSNAKPVAWNNVRSRTLLDSVPVQVARFRHRADSVDVVVATRLPLDSMLANLDVDPLPVLVRLKAMDARAQSRTVDSTVRDVARDSMDVLSTRSWRLRTDGGEQVLRVEALQADADRAARALAIVPTLPTRGFGMSDVLLGSPPSDVENADARGPQRWYDSGIKPRSGVLGGQRVLGLLWEVYDTSVRDGAMRYDVDIRLRPMVKDSPMFPLMPIPEIALALNVVERLGRKIKRSVWPDGVSIAYERSAPVPASGDVVAVEYLSLNLGPLTRGQYNMTVTITDPLTKQSQSRSVVLDVP